MEAIPRVIIYTDGSCINNPGIGGWCAILNCEGSVKEITGVEKETTNNRMELIAAIEGLKILKKRCEVTLYTDSKYLCEGMKNWINNWKKNCWKSKNKSTVKNLELWQQLDDLSSKHNITWLWVKGHADCDGNNRADYLARQAIKNMLQ